MIDLTEWLDWGPIATGSVEDRVKWLETHAPSAVGWDWLVEHVAEFLEKVRSATDRLIWIAPRSAAEQSGFFWYLDQMGDAGGQMIVADHPLKGAWRDEPPFGLGELNEEFMAKLLADCPRSDWDPTRFPLEKWRGLRQEGSLLRIVENGQLVTAPPDVFDGFLLRRCSTEWTKWLRVIGYVMCDVSDAGHRIDDQFLLWRLRELIKRGAIGCEGELPNKQTGRPDLPAMLSRLI